MFRRNLLLDLHGRIVNLAAKIICKYMKERRETRAAREPMLDDGLKEGQQCCGRKGDGRGCRGGSAKQKTGT
jgi:hypothetical protein